jgi:hypothetical protein
MREFRRVVSDTNILSLSVALEPVSQLYPQLIALALYANKLELAKSISSINKVHSLLYYFIEKDTLEDLIKYPL